VASVTSAPGRRYAKLVEAVGESLGHSYGWQSEAARKLGVTRSYISRLTSGARSKARPQTVDRAIYATGLPSSFFYGETEPTAEEYQKAATRERGARTRRRNQRSEVPKLDELSRRAALLLSRLEQQPGPGEGAVDEMVEIAEGVLDQALPQSARALLESAEGEPRWIAFQILCLNLYRATLQQSGNTI
jgi:transcriptional regulator with XRE-family HTH domain